MLSKRKHTELKAGLGAGLLAAFLATLCCTGPAVLALLGLGSLAGSLTLPRGHSLFLVLGLLVLGGGLWLAQRRATAEPCCGSQDGGLSGSHKARLRSGLLLTAALGVGVFAAAYAAVMNRGVPSLTEQCCLSSPGRTSAGPIRQADFRVKGMDCAACATGLEATLSRRPGVVEARVDYPAAVLHVAYRPAQVSSQALARALADLGYQASLAEGSAKATGGSR